MAEYLNCPSCLAENPATSQFCVKCGWNIRLQPPEPRRFLPIAVTMIVIASVAWLAFAAGGDDADTQEFPRRGDRLVGRLDDGPIPIIEIRRGDGQVVAALTDDDVTTVFYAMFEPGMTLTVVLGASVRVTGLEVSQLPAGERFNAHARLARLRINDDPRNTVMVLDQPGSQVIEIDPVIATSLEIAVDSIVAPGESDGGEIALTQLRLIGSPSQGG